MGFGGLNCWFQGVESMFEYGNCSSIFVPVFISTFSLYWDICLKVELFGQIVFHGFFFFFGVFLKGELFGQIVVQGFFFLGVFL